MSDEPERVEKRGGGSHNPQPHGGAIGNPPHEVTDEKRRQVRELAALQISQQEIGDVMGFSVDTIIKYYSADFHEGRAEQGLKLRRHAYAFAYGKLKDADKPSEGYDPAFVPDKDMTKFLLRSQFGFVDSVKQIHEGGDPSKPLNVELTHIRRVIVDPKKGE